MHESDDTKKHTGQRTTGKTQTMFLVVDLSASRAVVGRTEQCRGASAPLALKESRAIVWLDSMISRRGTLPWAFGKSTGMICLFRSSSKTDVSQFSNCALFLFTRPEKVDADATARYLLDVIKLEKYLRAIIPLTVSA